MKRQHCNITRLQFKRANTIIQTLQEMEVEKKHECDTAGCEENHNGHIHNVCCANNFCDKRTITE